MLLVLVIVAGVLYIVYQRLKMRVNNFPPGPSLLTVAKSALSVRQHPIHLRMDEWRRKYGPIVGLVDIIFPVVAVCGPEAVLEALRREQLHGRPFRTQFEDRSLNKRLGLMFNDGAAWSEQRRFTYRQLKELGFGKTSMEGIIQEEIKGLIKEIEGNTMQVSGLFNLTAVNVLCGTMAGTRYQHDDPKLRRLLNDLTIQIRGGNPTGATVRNVVPFIRHILPNIDHDFMKASVSLQNFIRELIKEHEETFDEGNPRDFIDVYLAEMYRQPKGSSSFTEESLTVICMDLFTAGAESTGNTLGFALLYMVLYPEIQDKVHAAIDSVLGRTQTPSLQHRSSLPYIEAVISEVQRCNTIAPITIPHRAVQDTDLMGFFIPKNSTIIVSMWSLMQDKEHWGDPENFRPERFLDGSGNYIKDKYFLPFGTGKRLCPGKSLTRNTLFVCLTGLLQHFTVTLPPGCSKPSALPLPGFTTAPQPFEVMFKPR